MSHSLDRLRFYNEDPDIGLFIWKLGTHAQVHFEFVTIAELRELSTALHADLQKIVASTAGKIDATIEDIEPDDIEDIVIVDAIALEIYILGAVEWTPIGQLKEQLEALACRNNEIYQRTIEVMCTEITRFLVSIIAPFCRDAPVDNQCVLNMIGQVPSVN